MSDTDFAPDEPEAPSQGDKVDVATLDDLVAVALPEAELEVETTRGARVVRLRALLEHDYTELMAHHPPEDVDRDAMGMPLRWNPRTFQSALISACLQEPALSPSEVDQFWKRWNKAAKDAFFQVVYDLNERRSIVTAHLGKGTATTLD